MSEIIRFTLDGEDVAVEKAALDAPAPSDLNRGELSSLNEVIDRWKGDPQILCSFLHGHEFGWFFVCHWIDDG